MKIYRNLCPLRLQVALAALRGNSVVYRCDVVGTARIRRDAFIAESTFEVTSPIQVGEQA